MLEENKINKMEIKWNHAVLEYLLKGIKMYFSERSKLQTSHLFSFLVHRDYNKPFPWVSAKAVDAQT